MCVLLLKSCLDFRENGDIAEELPKNNVGNCLICWEITQSKCEKWEKWPKTHNLGSFSQPNSCIFYAQIRTLFTKKNNLKTVSNRKFSWRFFVQIFRIFFWKFLICKYAIFRSKFDRKSSVKSGVFVRWGVIESTSRRTRCGVPS